MNFALITTIVLSLSNPFSVGLASTTVNSTVTAQFNELQLQVQQELKAEFTASVTSGEAPLTVTFDASASTGEGELTYEWWFGNGATATGANVSFTYEYSGEYVAILVVSDGNSESSTSQLIVVSSDKEPNIIQLPYTINTAEVGDDGQYIVLALLPTNINHVDTVPVFNTKQDRITFLRLVDANYHLISQEVVLPNIKESIHFDASNAVSAFALYTLSLNQVPSDDLIAIYPLIEQHPLFSEAVDRLRVLGGMRLVDIDASDPSILKFIADIGLEVARQYFIDNGTVNPDQLIPVEPE